MPPKTWTDTRGSEKMGPVTYFSLCLLGCLIFNPSLAGAQDVSCPRGWLPFQGYCYGYFFQEKTWLEAEVHCQHQGPGAHLVSIHSTGENKMLAHYIKLYHRKNSPVWIGLSDPRGDQSWSWVDKSLVNFRAWDKGQPDSQGANEHCTVFENSPDFQKWHDYPCEDRHPFICKRKP
ncbi:C-type lectin BpLec-like [Mauremys reevesii]|uniref:C-type lectin BpLec-like n=1 Tax=Mauremys reevesii TaxID=260615 RepID=UPI00193FB515|nr:C-type lectin BpLec-like [Mauremys reevesii]